MKVGEEGRYPSTVEDDKEKSLSLCRISLVLEENEAKKQVVNAQ